MQPSVLYSHTLSLTITDIIYVDQRIRLHISDKGIQVDFYERHGAGSWLISIKDVYKSHLTDGFVFVRHSWRLGAGQTQVLQCFQYYQLDKSLSVSPCNLFMYLFSYLSIYLFVFYDFDPFFLKASKESSSEVKCSRYSYC